MQTATADIQTIGVIPQTAGGATGSLITAGQPITDSGNQTHRVFVNATVNVGKIDPARSRVTLSSLPESDAPFVVDDGLFINGRLIGGFTSVKSDPKQSLGRDPIVAYNPIEPQDITADLRNDGALHIQAVDLGGYTFCCSRLYVRVTPR